jgi:peroxiredoxin (alkyl hydroperoxide reductase subunit C)
LFTPLDARVNEVSRNGHEGRTMKKKTKKKKAEGCVAAAAGPIVPDSDGGSRKPADLREGSAMNVTVGREAPDFEAAAYHEGEFRNVKLSDFRGKWTFLCFCPGDSTFV